MKTVLQRVQRAKVTVAQEVVGQIEKGVLALTAVERGDTIADVQATARKIATLRIFPDRTPMDLTLKDVGGACLLVSQFTIAGDVKKGRRPSFDRAELPQRANELYEALAGELRGHEIPVETGRFAAQMEVELLNDGPVTLIITSRGGSLE